MDLWITKARPELLELIKRVDLLVLNESEARQLTEETSLIRAGRNILQLGPKYVAIKKGEHGCLLLSQDQFFSCGAFPLEDIHDPTGAGDAFAGGFAGYLTSLERRVLNLPT
jgi:sugar/nucleoside kinase (ribokinase family)